MSPIIPIALLVGAVALIGLAIYLDLHNLPHVAIVSAALALLMLIGMVVTVNHANWDDDPYPAPSPSPPAAPRLPVHDPETCMYLAWLDERWVCIPRDEAG